MEGESIPAKSHNTQQEDQRRLLAHGGHPRENTEESQRRSTKQQEVLAQAQEIWDAAILTINRILRDTGLDPGVVNFVSPFDALRSMAQSSPSSAPARSEKPQSREQEQQPPQAASQSQHMLSGQAPKVGAQDKQISEAAAQNQQFHARQAAQRRKIQQQHLLLQQSAQNEHYSAQRNPQIMDGQQQFLNGAHQTPRLQQVNSVSRIPQSRPAQMMTTQEANVYNNRPQATGNMFQNFAGMSHHQQFQNQQSPIISNPSIGQAEAMIQNPANLQHSVPIQMIRSNSVASHQHTPEFNQSPQLPPSTIQHTPNIQHPNNNANGMSQGPSNHQYQMAVWFESIPPEYWPAVLQRYYGTQLPTLGNLMNGNHFRYISKPGVNFDFIRYMFEQTFHEISHLLKSQVSVTN